MIDEGHESQKHRDISMVTARWYPNTLESSNPATTFSIRCIATTSFEFEVAHTRRLTTRRHETVVGEVICQLTYMTTARHVSLLPMR
jgi:hypothetical protein